MAIRPHHAAFEWILGRVIAYHAETGAYDIADIDDSKTFKLAETQVVALDLANETMRKLQKGEEVLAVYPDTSTFYPATVVQAPRRAVAGSDPSVVLQFHGDADETGQTPLRTIPLKHVMRPPSLQ